MVLQQSKQTKYLLWEHGCKALSEVKDNSFLCGAADTALLCRTNVFVLPLLINTCGITSLNIFRRVIYFFTEEWCACKYRYLVFTANWHFIIKSMLYRWQVLGYYITNWFIFNAQYSLAVGTRRNFLLIIEGSMCYFLMRNNNTCPILLCFATSNGNVCTEAYEVNIKTALKYWWKY